MTTFVRVYSCKLYVIGILSPKCSDNSLCYHRRSHRHCQRLLSVDFDNLCRQPTRTSVLTQHVHWWHRSSMSTVLLPAALRAAQTCRYLVYSETDFEVFRPAVATRCTDGGEIWHGGGDLRSPPPCQISPPSVQRQGGRTPKTDILLRFHQNLDYKRPAGAYPLRDFHKICRVYMSFQDASGVNFLAFAQGVMELWGFQVEGVGLPPKFSAAPSCETMRQSPQKF